MNFLPLTPTAPYAAKENPEDPINRLEFRSVALLFEDGRLLAKGEILDDEARPRAKEPGKRDDRNAQ